MLSRGDYLYDREHRDVDYSREGKDCGSITDCKEEESTKEEGLRVLMI